MTKRITAAILLFSFIPSLSVSSFKVNAMLGNNGQGNNAYVAKHVRI